MPEGTIYDRLWKLREEKINADPNPTFKVGKREQFEIVTIDVPGLGEKEVFRRKGYWYILIEEQGDRYLHYDERTNRAEFHSKRMTWVLFCLYADMMSEK